MLEACGFLEPSNTYEHPSLYFPNFDFYFADKIKWLKSKFVETRTRFCEWALCWDSVGKSGGLAILLWTDHEWDVSIQPYSHFHIVIRWGMVLLGGLSGFMTVVEG